MIKRLLSGVVCALVVLSALSHDTGVYAGTAKTTELKIEAVAAGSYHSLALMSNGDLYAWGQNEYGQLGDGTKINKIKPVFVGTGYTRIAAGGTHSLALKGNSLYVWGNNNIGQLGDGTYTLKTRPVLIGTGYTAISAGGYHSLALKGSSLYTWGYSKYGQLGDGAIQSKNIPQLIGSGYTQISAGWTHSIALKDKALYAWGRNENGQLGDGTQKNRSKPVLIGTGFTKISAGLFHTLALKGNMLYAWGDNKYGQLGNKTNIAEKTPVLVGTNFSHISTGWYHSLALSDNALYAWGYNGWGQLGDGTNITKTNRVFIGNDYTQITAGGLHSLALKDNTIYSWGGNEFSQLGNGTLKWQNTPDRIVFFDSLTTVMPAGITLDKTSVSLSLGESIILKATVSPKNANPNITWVSSDKDIATVTPIGVVKGIKAGKATITVNTVNGKTAKCTVTVEKPPTYRALLIGNDKYAVSSKRQAGTDDLFLLGNALSVSQIYGGKYEKIEKAIDLSKDGMEQKIMELRHWGIGVNDVTLFFFSGHGSAMGTDVGLGGIDERGLPIKRLKELLDVIPGKKIVILSCCYAGRAIGKSHANAGPIYNQKIIDVFAFDAQKRVLETGGYHVITSCAGDDLSYRGTLSYSGHEISYLAYYISMAGGVTFSYPLDTYYPLADTNNDRYITISEAHAFACKYIKVSAPQIYPENSALPLFGRE